MNSTASFPLRVGVALIGLAIENNDYSDVYKIFYGKIGRELRGVENYRS